MKWVKALRGNKEKTRFVRKKNDCKEIFGCQHVFCKHNYAPIPNHIDIDLVSSILIEEKRIFKRAQESLPTVCRQGPKTGHA